jgi:hypothetical protein
MLSVPAVVVISPPLTARSPLRRAFDPVILPAKVVELPTAPILTVEAAPPILTVVAVEFTKLNTAAVVVMSPPLTARSASVPSAPEMNVSPPKITAGASNPVDDLFPETKSFTPDGSAGKLDAGESAMTSVPEIAVRDVRTPPVPILPETVPISAIAISPVGKYLV